MKLNKKVELGIKAVSVLKGVNVLRTEQIATLVGTTVNFMEQIMRSLRIAGIVQSIRGPGGGYTLASNQEVTAYAVAQALGKTFTGVTSVETDPTSRLTKSIADAFLSITI